MKKIEMALSQKQFDNMIVSLEADEKSLSDKLTSIVAKVADLQEQVDSVKHQLFCTTNCKTMLIRYMQGMG